MPLALLALAISAFGIGTTEFVIMGLLPNVAADLNTSVPTAGNLVSAYALGVVIGAPLLAIIGVRMPRKHLLILLMSIFVAGNLLSALSPNFGWALTGRFVTGLPHGAFFGAGSVVAAHLAPKGREGRAIATILLGLTFANIIGVPIATLVGQAVGWRTTFLAVTAIGVLAVVSLILLIPYEPAEPQQSLRRELSALRKPQVLLTLATAVFGFAGVFATYAYLSSITTHVMGLSESSVMWVLALSGIGMTIGVAAAGPLTDRAARPTAYASLAGLVIALVAFYFTAHIIWIALPMIVLLGAVGFLMTAPLQTMVIRFAGDAPTLSAASNHSAFNLANAGGVWLAGVAVVSGRGWMSTALVGAALAAAGLWIALVAGYLDRSATTNVMTHHELEPNKITR
ncbi:MFS transporter, DHA1 family, inner membrane transport protein [Streptosporangium subroseum]|uniref:MFS transporter, DHA1 family, inner membrane transport protein n=1 Tax=Streptosporangium subroseum TaxID=106412 RepID=A0A239BC84_9ACTN|nr:MFS transporter [Streptosporangium subroseum]SNS05577.1 MFS transporter, DHA1 family, inner membrane transport protein [Streptosporangium subroseum]